VELFEPCNGLWRLQLISVVDAEALAARRSARGDGNQPPRRKAAQKFMPDNDFKALAALSRTFFGRPFEQLTWPRPTKPNAREIETEFSRGETAVSRADW
jgi:hypothetical protein